MDRDERMKMLLEMQEHPEQFSEQALEQMLNDTEAQELMEATAQLKRAMKHDEFSMSGQGIENEWQDFASAHFSKQASRRGWFKYAAMFIGILLLTGIAYAAIRIIHNDSSAQETKPEDRPVEQRVTPTDTIKSDTIVKARPVVFDNVTLDSIAKDLAAYYQIEMELQNERTKQLRFYFVWKQDDSLQKVVEKLNMFEHVNMVIENDKLIVR